MEDIQDLRREIDKIDQEIVKLFNHRLEIAKKIALYKKANNLAVLDQKREDALLEKISKISQDEYKEETLKLYDGILKISKDYQKKHI